jgi:hypothetical protein
MPTDTIQSEVQQALAAERERERAIQARRQYIAKMSHREYFGENARIQHERWLERTERARCIGAARDKAQKRLQPKFDRVEEQLTNLDEQERARLSQLQAERDRIKLHTTEKRRPLEDALAGLTALVEEEAQAAPGLNA